MLCAIIGQVFAPSIQGEEATNKTLFLPKSPAAAAYVLARLSNKELIEAPRSEFVYVALLQRKGLERKYRVEALEGLVKIRKTDSLIELLAALKSLDKKGDAAEVVIRDLAPLVLQSKPDALKAKRSGLETLAKESQLAVTRQIGYAAMITAENSGDPVWNAASANPAGLADVILSIPLVREANLRAGFYAKLEPLLHQADPPELRRAAITAITSLPGHDAETFSTLATLLKSGTERAAAVASLQRIPRAAWQKDSAAALIESLVTYLQRVPVENRTEPDAVMAFQFASDLATLLPAEQAGSFGKTLRALGVSVFVVRTIPEQMLYDKTLIVVEAGKPVTLVLINPDAMPHNLVIVSPGAVEEVGSAAEKMPPEPDAQGRLYLPKSPKILYATKLVEPGQQTKLGFTAPAEPGDYQYVCTFPGHWRRMVGTLAVVKDVDAYLAAHTATATPKITEWKIADLTADISTLDSDGNIPRGKQLFTKLACATCHKVGTEGVAYGPELTDVFARYQNNSADVLRQILEPSLVISNRYRAFDFELQNGDELAGMVTKEDADTLMLQTGPSATLFQTLKKAEIKTQKARSSSIMPVGLLNTLSKDEIFDLLAFLKSGGKFPPHEHQH